MCPDGESLDVLLTKEHHGDVWRLLRIDDEGQNASKPALGQSAETNERAESKERPRGERISDSTEADEDCCAICFGETVG